MIKMIATDMDGTFLNDEKKFDIEFLDIYFRLKNQGIKFVIASGNQYYRLYQKFLPMSEDMYFIAENGSYIANGSTELYCDVINENDVDKIIDIMKNYPLFTIVCGKKGAYALAKDFDKKDIIKTYYCNYSFVNSFDDIDDDIMKIAIYDGDGTIDQYLLKVKDQLPQKVKVVTAGNTWMDIQNKTINKGIGMKFLQNIYDITPEECMAFGDQMNDYELLQSVKYSYAMANAVDAIKDIAYDVTLSNQQQGVIQTIKEVIFHNEEW